MIQSTEWIVGGFAFAFLFHLAGVGVGAPLRAVETFIFGSSK